MRTYLQMQMMGHRDPKWFAARLGTRHSLVTRSWLLQKSCDVFQGMCLVFGSILTLPDTLPALLLALRATPLGLSWDPFGSHLRPSPQTPAMGLLRMTNLMMNIPFFFILFVEIWSSGVLFRIFGSSRFFFLVCFVLSPGRCFFSYVSYFPGYFVLLFWSVPFFFSSRRLPKKKKRSRNDRLFLQSCCFLFTSGPHCNVRQVICAPLLTTLTLEMHIMLFIPTSSCICSVCQITLRETCTPAATNSALTLNGRRWLPFLHLDTMKSYFSFSESFFILFSAFL